MVNVLYVAGWGDPFGSPRYWSLLCNLSRLSPVCDVFLHTNGLLLTRERWGKLGIVADRVKGVTISIDAAREGTYDLNRGGSWGSLLRNLEFVASLGIPFHMNFVVQSNNFREMPEFVEMAFKHRVSGVYFEGLGNWDSFSPEEYAARAVHLRSHPNHGDLLDVLRNPVFREPRVRMALSCF